jgi:isocitrate dehydrogenase
LKRGNKALSNPIATIYAWTEGLKRVAQIEKNADLLAFCVQMQKAVDITVDDKKIVTRDMAVVMKRDILIKED